MKFEVIFARVEWYPFRFRKFCCCGIDGAGDRNLGFGLGGFSGACRSTGNQGQVKRQKGSSSSTAQSKSEKVAADRLLSNQGKIKRQKGSSSYTVQQPMPSQKAKQQQQLYCSATKAKSKGKKVAAVILLTKQQGRGRRGSKLIAVCQHIVCIFMLTTHMWMLMFNLKEEKVVIHLQSRVITENRNELLTRPSSKFRQWN